MKYLYLFIIPVILISCADKNEKSDAYGNFEAIETIISSEVTGKVIHISINEGQHIQAGKNIGLIDTIQLNLKKRQLLAQSRTVSTKINTVLAQIRVQKKQKENLESEKIRVKNLLKDEAATQKQLDDINNQVKVINEQIKAIEVQNNTTLNELKIYEQQIAQIQDQINRSILTNPINGTILEKYIEQYEIAVAGKALYKIANLNEMELRVYISGDQLPNIKIGQKVEVLIDKNKEENQSTTGTISWISDQAEFTPKVIQTKEERVNMVYAIKIKVKNDGSLKIGMPGEVNFQ